jgi:hypothetical protein
MSVSRNVATVLLERVADNHLCELAADAQQLKNSCGAASEFNTFRSSKPPHNSGLN